MSNARIAAIVAAALLLFWIIGAHNRLVALRNAIGAAWAKLDPLFSRRHALLPRLVAAARPHVAGDDAHALDALVAAGAQAAACADAVRARPAVAPRVQSLAMAEGVYAAVAARAIERLDPRAADDATLAPLLAELRELDVQVGFARQWFNEAATSYNEAARQFPTRLIAPLLGLRVAGRL